jgi:hypothetical protein
MHEHQQKSEEASVGKRGRRAVTVSSLLVCVLFLLSACVATKPTKQTTLQESWAKKGEMLVHPDKTVIKFEKPRYYRGKLTEEKKTHFLQFVTPQKLWASWGFSGFSPVPLKFSKRWEPKASNGRLQRFSVDFDYYCFAPPSGYKSGKKMTTKRIFIYRYIGADVTNRMGIGIMGYSDCVESHLEEFLELVDSMSF